MQMGDWSGLCLSPFLYNPGLLAVAADDFIIRLFDVVASRMVSKFEGHTDHVTDMCFSEDGKWLVFQYGWRSSSLGCYLSKDKSMHCMLMCLTALSLSPNTDILATSHVDQNGVYLWVNQSMFSGASKVDSYASGKRVVSVKLPSVSSTKGSEAEDSDEPVGNSAQLKDASALPTLVQQIPDLVTVSSYPKNQWQSLINLDVIKERNKTIEPPKKP